MRPSRAAAVLFSLLLVVAPARGGDNAADPSPWPEVTSENKPWTRWWWPGSAVDRASLTAQLGEFARVGLGGVEITPIYGARGAEDRYLEFLSPRWMEMLEHAAREARRLGLGVDMATGTGWPFGAPWVDARDASHKLVLDHGVLRGEPTGMAVKRAAPGGEGLVLDPYSPAALERYLAPFSRAFSTFPRELVRGQFHDSFEYYGAEWTSRLAQVFRELHGYDIADRAAELVGHKPTDPDTLARLKSDYRETLARLHLEYLQSWVRWSHAHGFVVRNQSHGAPGNLLDLYANADIPETEVFGSTPFPIPGLRRDPADVRHDQDLPEDLVIRMASSAAHVAGHPLASSETCTWLREHWKEALAFTKPELDRLFAAGINHVFYHGTVFSPQDAAWPGWLFYASTQVNPNNPWWDDLSAVNAYVTRIQSVLQRGHPDNEILVYWPVYDVWDRPDGLMLQLGVHQVNWLTDQPVGTLARGLLKSGFSYDLVSDAQLFSTRVEDGALRTPGGAYRILLVPATRRMPVETLARLVTLAAAGARVCFLGLPEDVPGLGRLDVRRAAFHDSLTRARALAESPAPSVSIIQSGDVAALHRVLEVAGVARESTTHPGLHVLRRASDRGHDYFFANLGSDRFEGWMPLGKPARTARILDPLTGAHGEAALRHDGTATEVYLQLAAGVSLLLRTSATADTAGPRWAYQRPSEQPIPLTGSWTVEFIKGGPELPPSITTGTLRSWTELAGDAAQRFAGTARYRLEFERPSAAADAWWLELGDVRDSARVRLNGEWIGTVWSLPFRVDLGQMLKPGTNVLELEVTNLAANRVRDLDRRGEPWKIMREINFVNINYRPFDASGWPLTPSGLLGPVSLVPVRVIQP